MERSACGTHFRNEDQSWKPGKVLPGGYRIMRRLGQGGMGTVYLVERETYRGDRVRFALKVLREKSMNKGSRQNAFLRELRNWIDLPQHPHLTQCRFFQTIVDRIGIFSEFVDGGSLTDWIRAGKIRDSRQVFQLAIQSAWALAAAHESGMFHLDIKPSNILLTRSGTLKITDFGLSVGLPDRIVPESATDISTSSHGLTPAFASPEQLQDFPLTHASDQWSWATTFLYVFTGRAEWQYGIRAGQSFAELASREDTPIPEALIPVMRRCFHEDPELRYSGFCEIADTLLDSYRHSFGQDYPEPEPEYRVSDDFSPVSNPEKDSKQDKAIDVYISKVCEQMGEDIQQVFDSMPVRKGSDRTRLLVNLERINRIQRKLTEAAKEEPEKWHREILRCHFHKSNILRETDDMTGSMQEIDNALQRVKVCRSGMSTDEIESLNSELLLQKASLQIVMGQHEKAVDNLSLILKWLDKPEIAGKKAGQLLYDLCRGYLNLAAALGSKGKPEKSMEIASIAIDRLTAAQGIIEESERLKLLAGAHTNRAASKGFMDRDLEAAEEFLISVNLVEKLIDEFACNDLLARLVQTRLNAANAFLYAGHEDKAEQMAVAALEILNSRMSANNKHVVQNKIFASDLLIHILNDRGQYETALSRLDDLIRAVDYDIYERGKNDHIKDLIRLFDARKLLLDELGNHAEKQETEKLQSHAKAMFESLQ